MIFDPILDFFRGKAVTIPPMDGAFRPNTELDDAALLCDLAEADNLAILNGDIIATSGNAIYVINPDKTPELLKNFEAPITALAVSPEGQLAVALETGQLLIEGEPIHLLEEIRAITALAYSYNGALWLANGSSEHTCSDWAADLMNKRATGSLWVRHQPSEAFHKMADNLAYPSGLCPLSGGRVVFSESWRHRLMQIDADKNISLLIDHIPGYPARLSPTADGGAILSVFAPRNRLIEFVLQETHYRYDMMATVPREYWIAPALSSGRSFLEPLQCGSIRTMGVHKAWSPARSYGLVVRLGANMNPLTSMHSRANGTRHGVCSAIEHEGRLVIASKGGDCLIEIADTNAKGH
ncbi:hypothetical protein [Cohaesibacter celericrescens]|uniref:hypothetical protein n=1 Tax=Cohaesibacter celericrescens TaxID=2067669 RepID=UPI003561D4C6